MSNEIKTLKKMTLKSILGCESMSQDEYVTFMKTQADGRDLAIIGGEIAGYGGKSTKFGESFFFAGNFLAQNRITGQFFRSGKVYLTKDATETLIAAFNSRSTPDSVIEFQFLVKVISDKSCATGYSYVCEAPRSPETINREAQLMQRMLALPAPAKESQQKKKA